jgi:hypothetical protein
LWLFRVTIDHMLLLHLEVFISECPLKFRK